MVHKEISEYPKKEAQQRTGPKVAHFTDCSSYYLCLLLCLLVSAPVAVIPFQPAPAPCSHPDGKKVSPGELRVPQ
jgi:hypothetical protein